MPQFDTPINTNDQSLERVLANPLPVLLVVNSDAGQQNVLNEIARAEVGKLLVVKLNTGENPEAAKRLNAHGSASIIVWKAGAEQFRLQEPGPEQIQQAASFALGRGPAPKAT